MRSPGRILTDSDRADIARYRHATAGLSGPLHYDVTDLPDEAIHGLVSFSMWRVGEALRTTFETLIEVVIGKGDTE